MRGVVDDPKKTKEDNLLQTTEKMNEMLILIVEKRNIVEMKRLGNFGEKIVKQRSLLITL